MLTDVHLPLLPLQLVPVHLEAHALGLHDVQRLEIVSELELLALLLHVLRDEVRQPVVARERRRDAPAPGRRQRVLREVRRRCLRGRQVEVEAVRAQRARALRGLLVFGREVDVDDLLGDGVDNRDEVLLGVLVS